MYIREVKLADAAQIIEIYNYYIESTAISFEEEPVSVDTMEQRISEILNYGLPWLVAEKEGKVVGYAYAGRWKTRSAYRYTIEPSIYVEFDRTGEGIGITLYSALLAELKAHNYQNAISVIALPNPSSVGLHERLGFKKVGEFANIGVKFGESHSVGYWQLEL